MWGQQFLGARGKGCVVFRSRPWRDRIQHPSKAGPGGLCEDDARRSRRWVGAEVVAVAFPLLKFGDVSVDAAGDCQKFSGCGVLQRREILPLVGAHVEHARARPILSESGTVRKTCQDDSVCGPVCKCRFRGTRAPAREGARGGENLQGWGLGQARGC
jgi:hypothetical protein